MAATPSASHPEGLQPHFFQKHHTAILATSALITAVSLFAVGYFAALGAASFMTTLIPLSFMAVGSTAFFIAALIKKPLPKIQAIAAQCHLDHNPVCARQHDLVCDRQHDLVCDRQHDPVCDRQHDLVVCTRRHIDDSAASSSTDSGGDDDFVDATDTSATLTPPEFAVHADVNPAETPPSSLSAPATFVHDHTDVSPAEVLTSPSGAIAAAGMEEPGSGDGDFAIIASASGGAQATFVHDHTHVSPAEVLTSPSGAIAAAAAEMEASDSDDDFAMIASASGTAPLGFVHDHSDPNSTEILAPLGIDYLPFDALQTSAQAIEVLSRGILEPLFEEGKQIYCGIIRLYMHIYGHAPTSREADRITQTISNMDNWKHAIQTALHDPDFFVWMGVDSAFTLDLMGEAYAYRNGEKTLEQMCNLLKCKAFALCGDARLDGVINQWFEKLKEAPLQGQLKMSEPEERRLLVQAYAEMEETQKAQLTWLFGSLIHRRLSNDLIRRWNDITDELQMTDSDEARMLNRLHWCLTETVIWAGGKAFATKIRHKIATPLVGLPLERFVPLIMEMTKPLMLPLALAKCPVSKLHPILRRVTEDSRLDKTNLMTLAVSLRVVFQERMA